MRRKHKRRFRKKQIIKRNIYITTSIFCLSLILTIAYSSFSTSLTLNTKGNLKEITASQYLKTKIISSGDGLYKDYTENNRYIYKGKSPNNYIKFNNELWRIISIKPDSTLKIVKDDTLGSMQFDSETNRNNDSNTYCNRENTYHNETKYYGCGVWTATTTEYSDGIYSGTVTQNATLNTYLNNEYYTALNKDTQYITTHNFNIGLIERKEQTTIEEMYNGEKNKPGMEK